MDGRQKDAEGDRELVFVFTPKKEERRTRGHDATDIASRNIKRAEISSRR